MVQFKTRLMKVASYFSSYKWPYCVERRSKLLYDFWQFFQQLFGIPVSNFTVFCEHNRDRVIGDSLWQPGKGVLRSIIVCTGRILFGREKRISREHASERRSREGGLARAFSSREALFAGSNRRTCSQTTKGYLYRFQYMRGLEFYELKDMKG